MKRIATSVLLASLVVLAACKKEDKNPTPTGTNPIEGLVVSEDNAILVVENTGAWCQYCPNGAEILVSVENAYPQVIGVAVHNNDPLASPTAMGWELAFPAGGYPTIHVNGNALDNYNDANNEVLALLGQKAAIGAAHKVSDVDSAYAVDVKIEVFENMAGREFFVQSFLLIDGVLAKNYGPDGDLRQTSSVPLVTTGSDVSVWAQDAAFVDGVPTVFAGDNFYHLHNIWSAGYSIDSTYTPQGLPLSVVNPFGNEYIEGDVFGTQYSPIRFFIDKPTLPATWQTTGLSALTMIWELYYEDATLKYRYINACESHIN
ncbi:hypothetical protein GC167_09050 [bacterium]|nr:hypothetical protein [bacterium]